MRSECSGLIVEIAARSLTRLVTAQKLQGTHKTRLESYNKLNTLWLDGWCDFGFSGKIDRVCVRKLFHALDGTQRWGCTFILYAADLQSGRCCMCVVQVHEVQV